MTDDEYETVAKLATVAQKRIDDMLRELTQGLTLEQADYLRVKLAANMMLRG